MSRILMVVAAERFRDEELFLTREVLEGHGHEVTLASTKTGKLQGSRGGSAEAEKTLDVVTDDGFAAVVFVGGGGSKQLWNDVDAQRLARRFFDAEKVVGAICLAPVILARAGVLAGKAATVTGTEAKTIEAAGARYMGPGVTVDGRVVTANAPKASRAFAEAIASAIG